MVDGSGRSPLDLSAGCGRVRWLSGRGASTFPHAIGHRCVRNESQHKRETAPARVASCTEALLFRLPTGDLGVGLSVPPSAWGKPIRVTQALSAEKFPSSILSFSIDEFLVIDPSSGWAACNLEAGGPAGTPIACQIKQEAIPAHESTTNRRDSSLETHRKLIPDLRVVVCDTAGKYS